MIHRITATRRGLTRAALLAVVWLNMAVTPCAMAFEAAEHDCPHCPPAEEHAMPEHHGHGEVERSCATMQSDCCDVVEATVDTRNDKFRTSPDVVYISAPVVAGLSPSRPQITVAADPPDPPPASRRLHVLNCVYLD